MHRKRGSVLLLATVLTLTVGALTLTLFNVCFAYHRSSAAGLDHEFALRAAESGANEQIAKTGGLLHDIGKAVTHEVPGPHAEIGAEIAKKHGINSSSYRGILEHHSDDHETVESFLVATADAISASRPGARRESLELYVKRLKELEEIATSFNGVERVCAIQAGREVRVMVKPDDLNDIEAAELARNIAKKVEEDLVFPGQIKVTVIRETRNVEYAK